MSGVKAPEATIKESLTAQAANGLQLGDRVRINETCLYQELIGDFGFVAGMTMRPNLTVNVWLSDAWPPQRGGSDEWNPSELDKVSA